MRQGKLESLHKYYKRFICQVDVMNEVKVSVTDEAMVEEVARANGRHGAPTDIDRAEAKERTLAMRFIRGGIIRFKTYLTELLHGALNGMNNYPETLTHNNLSSFTKEEVTHAELARTFGSDPIRHSQPAAQLPHHQGRHN
jgi:hypothetical protein